MFQIIILEIRGALEWSPHKIEAFYTSFRVPEIFFSAEVLGFPWVGIKAPPHFRSLENSGFSFPAIRIFLPSSSFRQKSQKEVLMGCFPSHNTSAISRKTCCFTRVSPFFGDSHSIFSQSTQEALSNGIPDQKAA